MRSAQHIIYSAVVAGIAVLIACTPASANWLTALTKGAGKAAHHIDPHLGPIGRAAGHLSELPSGAKSAALAAHATPEGHWQFINKEGQAFTAGTPDEMSRVAAALLPEAGSQGKLALYLSEDSVFANRQALDGLPREAELHVVSEKGAFPLIRTKDGAIAAQLRPNVKIALAEKGAFDDAVNFLTKPLNKSNIRTLGLQPGEAKHLSSAPKVDPATKTPLVDTIDPDGLEHALSSIRGQTALVVGRIDGKTIVFKPASGPEITRDLDGLLNAAHSNDVNLVILQADTPLQPGGRNWLWQKIEIGGFSDAMSQSTFADFLNALAAKRGPMQITAANGADRVRLSVVADAGGAVQGVQESLGQLVADVTGEIATKAIEIQARDELRDKELDTRFIPGIPSYVQIPYIVAILFGLFAWDVSRSWWRRIWAPPPRVEGEGRLMRVLKGVPNFLTYLLAFLPVTGPFAFLVHAAVQLWAMVTAPFRWLRRIMRRKVEV